MLDGAERHAVRSAVCSRADDGFLMHVTSRWSAISFVLASIAFAVACAPRPEQEGGSADSGALRTPSAAAAHTLDSIAIRGTCCPATDSGIMALMQRSESTPERERAPELAMLHYRGSSGFTTAERIVVRDSTTWATVWPRIVGSHRPSPPVPRVDFATEMIVVASMGTRATGGYTIAIASVHVVGDSVRVVVREQSPGTRCGTTAALGHPVALARVDRSERPVAFVTRSAVHECP